MLEAIKVKKIWFIVVVIKLKMDLTDQISVMLFIKGICYD